MSESQRLSAQDDLMLHDASEDQRSVPRTSKIMPGIDQNRAESREVVIVAEPFLQAPKSARTRARRSMKPLKQTHVIQMVLEAPAQKMELRGVRFKREAFHRAACARVAAKKAMPHRGNATRLSHLA